MTCLTTRTVFRAASFGGASLLTCLASPAIADPVAIVEGWVARSADSAVMEIVVDAVNHDPSTGRTIVTGLAIELSFDEMARAVADMIGVPEDEADLDGAISYTLRVPAVSFTDLAQSDGYFTAAAVEADAVLLEAGIDLADADMGETSAIYRQIAATDLRWARVPAIEADADRPLSQFVPLLRAITDVSFTDMQVAEVITRSALPEDAGEVVQRIDRLRLAGGQRGDIAQLAAQSFSMTAPDPETGDPLAVAAGPVSASDYNYGTMIDVLLGQREEDDFVPAIGSFELADLRVSVPGEGFSMMIDRIAAIDVGARTPSVMLVPYLDELVIEGRANPDFEPDPAELGRFIGALYGAMRLGEFEMNGLSVVAEDEFSAAVDAFGIRNLSAEGLGSFFLRGIDFSAETGDMIRYDEFEIADIGFPSLEALIELGIVADDGEPPVDLVLAALPTLGRVVNSGIRIRAPEEGLDLALDGSVFEMSDHIGPIPTRLALSVDRLQINTADLDGEGREVFEALDYETVVLSADLLARWREQDGDVRLEGEAELAEGGRLSIEALVGNVPRLVFEQPDQTGLIALLGATFKRLDARYDDDSLVERGIALAARDQDVSREAIRAQLLAMVPILASELGDVELAANATAAFSQLIENGTPVVLSMAAPAPLPLVAMAMSLQNDPLAVLGALDIEVGNPG